MSMKMMVVAGTRPEILRLSRVIEHLDVVSDVELRLVHTGQNFDYRLFDIFVEELGLRKPDHFLKVNANSFGDNVGSLFSQIEVVLDEEKPDAFLVLGDTNSALTAVVAKQKKIPTYHLEAGNRSFDDNVPEEVNRRIIDHAVDFNLVYSHHARENLLAEGLHPRRICLVGSPLREVLDHYRPRILESPILPELGLVDQGYLLVSMHRQENVNSRSRLSTLLSTLTGLVDHFGVPVVVSTHPRTRDRIDQLVNYAPPAGLRFCEPFSYFEYCRLQMGASCVVSDSGSISEEAAILNFKAVSIREAIERPESLDVGTLPVVGLELNNVLSGLNYALASTSATPCPKDYEVENTSRRVLNFILSTLHQNARWHGLHPADNP